MIKDILAEALYNIIENKLVFIKTLILPFSLLGIFSLIKHYNQDSISIFVSLLFPLFIELIVVITTYRIILKGSESVPEWGLYKITKREVKFVYFCVAFIIFMLPMAFVTALLPIIEIAGILIMLYLFSRISLVFPAAAIDQSYTFSKSWNTTKGHQLQMIAITIILPIVISIPGGLVSGIAGMGWALYLITFLTTIYSVAALAIAFKVLAGPVDKADEYISLQEYQDKISSNEFAKGN